MDVSAVLAHAPFGGRYEKDGAALDGSLVRALERS